MKKQIIYVIVVLLGLFLFLTVQKAWSEELKVAELADWEVAEIIEITDAYGVFVLCNPEKTRFAVCLIRRDGMIFGYTYFDGDKLRHTVLRPEGYVELPLSPEHAKQFLDVLARFEKKVRL